jgi:hypothetical protein
MASGLDQDIFPAFGEWNPGQVGFDQSGVQIEAVLLISEGTVLSGSVDLIDSSCIMLHIP